MLHFDSFMEKVVRENPAQPEFHQAVREVAETVIPFINEHPEYEKARVLDRLIEPDRIIVFRVTWEDDNQHIQINRGYRVQFSNAIGPYKGGLRFDPSVSLSVLKFLGFEQVFKNSLTSLPMGGAKGGSNFNPKGRSDEEIRRFCYAFMSELHRHIGPNVDVPAGDIGVGEREIGYMFGYYTHLRNEFSGVLTGKGIAFGGSPVRTEATGYGCVYFAREMLATRQESLEGKTALVSGAGHVALYAAEKLIDEGARVLTLSDRSGTVYFPSGLDRETLQTLIHLKLKERRSLADFSQNHAVEFFPGKRPWHIPADMAFPCATQNELDASDAQTLLKNGCKLVCEGANMPSTYEATHLFLKARILYGPGKAANAGGVAVSGLEMTQNAMRLIWSREEVDKRLQDIMHKIHKKCVRYGTEPDGFINYVKGANIGGFIRVADALLAYGAI